MFFTCVVHVVYLFLHVFKLFQLFSKKNKGLGLFGLQIYHGFKDLGCLELM